MLVMAQLWDDSNWEDNFVRDLSELLEPTSTSMYKIGRGYDFANLVQISKSRRSITSVKFSGAYTGRMRLLDMFSQAYSRPPLRARLKSTFGISQELLQKR